MKDYRKNTPLDKQLVNANSAIRLLLLIIIIETLFLIF